MERTPPAPRSGGGIERLENLSDSVFSIAMTLLVLDITVRRGLSDKGFHEALHLTLPHIAAYALSFAVISQFWLDHRRILAAFDSLDGKVTGLTLLGLGLTALLPFPTALLAEYSAQPQAVAVYALSVTALNSVHLALLVTSHRRRGPARDRAALHGRRLDTADLASTVLVFGVTAPLAFVSPYAAMWCWVALIPAKFLIGRLYRRARTPSGGQTE
ncbi:putative membrane protein [Streptomyces sp. Amel2xB2]|uniref:TMEM175 family protein n=1 Tax=Streptomyces sp. Amel2xB2 TaxID=1305829 RepID=UPI000DC00EC9|nr:TMEM175 family protein [Streptomyces sp. Amel2xB2]RAJ57314.1 putative membrane protein [Streptomyces sp. Amel2xB2]